MKPIKGFPTTSRDGCQLKIMNIARDAFQNCKIIKGCFILTDKNLSDT